MNQMLQHAGSRATFAAIIAAVVGGCVYLGTWYVAQFEPIGPVSLPLGLKHPARVELSVLAASIVLAIAGSVEFYRFFRRMLLGK